jgi:phosphatidylinositol alpha-1,6-mannosyltransferase
MRRVLIVTNDFPPRQGGIQSYVHELAIRQPAGSVVVYASDHPGAAAFDAAQPFPVLRHPTGLLVPTVAARR